MMDWFSHLRNFGARSEDIILLDGYENPSVLPYLDLVDGRSKHPELMPEAVIEVQQQPLLYLFSEASFAHSPDQNSQLERIKKLFIMRGDTSLIGIVQPGVLVLHSTSQDLNNINHSHRIIESDADAPWLIPKLAQGNSPLINTEKLIETTLFRLLEESAKDLHNTDMPVAEIVSLTGRAVFLRFLLVSESLFLRKIFSGILLEKISKNDATTNACGGPDSSCGTRFSPNKGAFTLFHNDLTRYRDALQFFSASYEKPPGPVRYLGLKIFTSLSLRFLDFQR